MKKVLSFDAETTSLRGSQLAIGAILYNEDGTEASRFLGWRNPKEGERVDNFVKENILPKIATMPVEFQYQSCKELLKAFANWYMENGFVDAPAPWDATQTVKQAVAIFIAHCGAPVEANLIQALFEEGLIGEFNGPFPLHEVGTLLLAKGEDPASVNSYNTKFGLQGRDFGGTHNPLDDSEKAYRAFRHLMGW